MKSFPEEFYWISDRLVRAVVETDRAIRSKRFRPSSVEPTIGLPGFSVGTRLDRGAEERSIYSDAVEATRILQTKTGTLVLPNEYVRFTLSMRTGTITVQIKDIEHGGSRFQRIAVIYTNQYVEGIGDVFMAFFGSPNNILADMDHTPYTPCRIPSAAPGLMRIINDTRTAGEPEIQSTHTQESLDAAYIKSDQDRIYWANAILDEITDPLPPQPLEVLARVDSRLTEIYLDATTENPRKQGRHVAVALVGAVLWAGKASAVDFSSDFNRREKDRLFGLLDESARAAADGLWRGNLIRGLPVEEQIREGHSLAQRAHVEEDEPHHPGVLLLGLPNASVALVNEAHWSHFISWFVATCNTAGLKPIPLYKTRSWLDPRRYGYNASARETGHVGYAIPAKYSPSPNQRQFVCVNGPVVPVRERAGFGLESQFEIQIRGQRIPREFAAVAMWRFGIDRLLRRH